MTTGMHPKPTSLVGSTRSISAAAVMLACALGAAPLLAQAPGAGDPAFPRDTPPPKREKPPSAPSLPTTPVEPGSRMGKVDLRPRFYKGSETRYVMRVKSDNNVNMPGLLPTMPGDEPAPPKPQTPGPGKGPATPDSSPASGTGGGQRQAMDQEVGFVIRVIETTPEDGATVELVYERVKVSMQSGGAEIFWDSTKPKHPNSQLDDSELLEPLYRKMIGAKLTIRFDSAGTIKSVEGGGDLGLPGAMGQAGLPIDPKNLASLFGPVSTKTPGGGLYDIGEKWSTTDTVNTGPIGSFKMITTNELRSAMPGEADVYFSGRIEPGSAGGTPGSPFQIKDSKYQGKFKWDRLRGQLKALESEQDITIEGGPGVSGGMKAKSTVRIEREEPKRK
jgi:hypothetical protein